MTMRQYRVTIGLAVLALLTVTGVHGASYAGAITPAPAAPVFAPSPQDTVDPLLDPASDTSFAEVDLQAGFILDPYLLRVVGSGDRAAAEIDEACQGFVSDNPDAVLNWSDETDRLSFFVYSDGDPVLVVQTPSGDFLCNDDAGLETVDPLVSVENPPEGSYRIHVGSFAQDEPVIGFLAITSQTFGAEDLAALDLAPVLDRRDAPDPGVLPELTADDLFINEQAVFGTAELEPGFEALAITAAGGGEIPAFTMEEDEVICAGFLSPVPAYSFTWTGATDGLRVEFEAEQDSSLLVVTPAGDLLCNANIGDDNLNSAVDILEPADGQYDIYIGSYSPTEVVVGTLTITGDPDALAEALAPAIQ